MELAARSGLPTAAKRAAVVRVAEESPTVGLESDRSAGTAENLVETALVEQIANRTGQIFEHDGERLP